MGDENIFTAPSQGDEEYIYLISFNVVSHDGYVDKNKSKHIPELQITKRKQINRKANKQKSKCMIILLPRRQVLPILG
jgi:hypothetical protein